MVDNTYMQFWERVKAEIKEQNTTQGWIAGQIPVPADLFRRWISKNIMPNADQAVAIAKALGTSVEALVTGMETPSEMRTGIPALRAILVSGIPEQLGEDGGIMVPLFSQKVSAGRGQEIVDYEEISGMVPIPSRIARRFPGFKIAAMEVRGDSMTKVNIFDGDLVYFGVGLHRDDGIYVIDVNGERLVKRLQFDYMDKAIKIHSENERYPQIKTVPMESDTFCIVGKVIFTLHVHPY